MTPALPRKLLFTALLAVLPAAQAENLLDVYRLAQQNDLTLQQAQATYQAGVERGVQGQGQVLPTLAFTASHFAVNSEVKQPDLRVASPTAAAPPYQYNYDSDLYLLQLTQPLYRKSNFASYAQGKAIISQSEADLAIAQGDLMLRTVQSYFDVLAADDALILARTEKAAIKGQLDLAQRNFSVGSATVIDVHEARARYDLAIAQEASAENDVQIKREALAVLIDKNPEALARLSPNLELAAPTPTNMEAWNQIALETSPLIQAQVRALKVADEEIEKNRGSHYPTLDLVATHGYSKGGSFTSPSILEYTANQIGVQLAVPLYSGGITQSKVREATAKREQTRTALELAKRNTTRLTREAFLAVTSGITRVRALELARISSKQALESTLIGYESGARTGVEVLNAQQALYRTERDLSQARYTYLLSHLRLKLVSGTLSEADLVDINNRLTGP